jgi:hypothetical protein
MGFKDLNDFFDPTLRLPIKGKWYVIQSPAADLGLEVQRLVGLGVAADAGADLTQADLESLELDDETVRDLIPRLLGDAYAVMKADGLPWAWIQHAGTTALFWVGMGYEAAEQIWANAPGEHKRPATQDRKAPAKKSTTRKTSSTRTTAATAANSPGGSTPPSEATTPS